MCRRIRWASRSFSLADSLGSLSGFPTSASAPSIHTYRALFLGHAFFINSDMATPVKSAVETPAGPHEKPLLFLT